MPSRLHSYLPLACLTALLAACSAQAGSDHECLAGPACATFRLTLASGWRQEVVGPLFYEQTADGQRQWAIPPFFCSTITPDVNWREWEFFYPVINYRRFGGEYRLQLAQIFSLSGGDRQDEKRVRMFTIFPIYFQQRSRDTNLNYTAVVPFYGHLTNRLLRDDVRFVLFPIYSETRKKGVVTDNYIYPVFDTQRGQGTSGWQFWPLAGEHRKTATLATNSMNDLETNGGYDRFFALWPFCLKNFENLGTTNPSASMTVMPFYSQTRSLSRKQTSIGFPFGFNSIDDRGEKYIEHDFLWPLFVWAHGSKQITRYFPIYSRAQHNGMESRFYGFLLYKYNRLQSSPLDRHRARLLYFLYSDTVERNTQTHDSKRRVDAWPLWTYNRDLDGNRRTQVLAILEPIFPNNRTIIREYSPLWTLWKAEKNARTGAASQSLLWNLYRRETAGKSKIVSLLFGVFQYQSMPDGGRWRFCHLNVGGQPARTTATK